MGNIPRDTGLRSTSPQGNSNQLSAGQTILPAQPRAALKLGYDLSRALDPMRFEFATINGEPIHYTTAEDILMPVKIQKQANELGRKFFNRTGSPLHITSGRRTPIRQAKAMYKKFRANVRKDYTGPLGREIISVYDHAVGHKYNERQTISAMAHAIQNQIDRGQYVSNHLRDNAIDIKWQNDKKSRDALSAIALEDGHILKNEDYPKHHHFTFTPRK